MAPDWHSSGPQKMQFGELDPRVRWRAIRVTLERGKAVTAEARRLADIEDRLSRAARCSSPEERAFIMHEPARELSEWEMWLSILKHARASNLEPRVYTIVWMMVDLIRRRLKADHMIVGNETNPIIARDLA